VGVAIDFKFKEQLGLGEIADLLEALRQQLSPDTYTEFFQKLLWCETEQKAVDIRFFDIESTVLASVPGGCLSLRVHGLAENRPSVLRGDKVKVRIIGKPGTVFNGYAHQIRQEDVHLKFSRHFHQQHIAGQRVSVEFTNTDTPMRVFHQGLVDGFRELPRYLLFPKESDVVEPQGEFPPAQRAHRGFAKLNEQQQQAVEQITNGGGKRVPYIIYGPPGTGKTTTLVMAVLSLLRSQPSGRILCCGPSNSAADLLVEKLSDLGVLPAEMVRVMAFSRSPASVPPKVLPYAPEPTDDHSFPFPPELGRYRIVVVTLTTGGKVGAAWCGDTRSATVGHLPSCFSYLASCLSPSRPRPLTNPPSHRIRCLHSASASTSASASASAHLSQHKLWNNGVERGHFGSIFVDEAGHALEPEAVAPIAMLRGADGRVVFAGDPKVCVYALHSSQFVKLPRAAWLFTHSCSHLPPCHLSLLSSLPDLSLSNSGPSLCPTPRRSTASPAAYSTASSAAPCTPAGTAATTPAPSPSSCTTTAPTR
jgi:helicase MOV-10